MKILYVSRVFPDIRGGIADYVYALLKNLASTEHELHILTSNDPAIMKTAAFCNIYPIVDSWSMKNLFRILTLIRTIKPSVIHIIHDSSPYKKKRFLLSFLPFFLRIFYPYCKIVTTIHEFREHRLRWKLRHLSNLMFSHKVIFVDSYDLLLARRQFPFIAASKYEHIPIAASIIPDKSLLGVPKQAIRKQLGLKPESVIIFYFGEILPHKGVDELVDVFEKMSMTNINVVLLLISSFFSSNPATSYKKRLLERIRNSCCAQNIISFGYQSSERLSLYMLSSDIAVFPFSFGVSLQRSSFLAALAHKLCTIASYDSHFYPNQLGDGKNVVLYNVKNKQELYEKLKQLLDDTNRTRLIGESGWKFYLEHHSWPLIVERTTKLYTQLLRASVL